MRKLLVFLLLLSGFCITESHASLKLTCPNGGEKFVVGSDTLITWEGILPTDTVKLEYSIDNGLNWKLISDNATGLKYVWKNIPKPISNNCFVKIKPNVKGDSSRFEPAIEWQKTYGGSKDDIATAIQQTSDSGYIVAGTTYSNDGDVSNQKGNGDFWVVKLDKLGILVWQRTYGGSSQDEANSIQQTFDGGYIVGGGTWSTDGDVSDDQGYYVSWNIKLDASGNIEWEKCFGTHDLEPTYFIQQTREGGYIIVGEKGQLSRHKVLKLDKNGNIEWEQYFVKKGSNHLEEVKQTTDGGYISAGWSWNPYPIENFWILKLDSLGKYEWDKNYGGSKQDEAHSIQQTKDGGYFVVGSASSADGDVTNNKGAFDCWVLKLDKSGNMEWQKTYGGSKNDLAFSGQQTNDGGYVLTGKTRSFDGDMKDNSCPFIGSLIIKIDELGIIEWQKYLCIADYNLKNSIQQTNDRGYILAGPSGYIDENGIQWADSCTNFYIVKLGPSLLTDQSDSVFSIIAPQAQANDIDMKKCYLGSAKDSLIADFVSNVDDCKFRIDSIYFSGADKDAFKLVSPLPKYNLKSGESKATNIEFTPNKIGLHTATINIITQSDTLIRNIQGIGVGQIFITVKNDSAYAGQVRRLKLVMSNLKPEIISAKAQNFSAKIRFQKTILTPIKKSERNIVNDSIYVDVKGTIGTSYELGQVLVITGLGNVEETAIDILDFKLTDNSGNFINDFDIKTEPGLFKLLGICREGGTRLINPTGKAEILSTIPNPASDDIEININLIEEGSAALSIYSTNGTKMKVIDLKSEIGLQTINIDGRAFANGLYFIQLQTPTVSENKKLMMIK